MKWGYYYKEKVPPIEDFTDGSHIIVVHKTNYYISNIVKLEDEGWEVRDCIKIQFQNESLQAGLLRKTFKGTVANNTIKNGCGGINIGACRIGAETKGERPIVQPHNKGRFPSNLLLECTCEEVIKGENHGVVINNKNSPNFTDDVFCGGWNRGEQEAPRMYKDEGDTHTDENCPCYQLDLQSGIAKSQGRATTGGSGNVWTLEKDSSKEIGYGDIGGASRYFYTFGDEDELKNYLISMIKCDNV